MSAVARSISPRVTCPLPLLSSCSQSSCLSPEKASSSHALANSFLSIRPFPSKSQPFRQARTRLPWLRSNALLKLSLATFTVCRNSNGNATLLSTFGLDRALSLSAFCPACLVLAASVTSASAASSTGPFSLGFVNHKSKNSKSCLWRPTSVLSTLKARKVATASPPKCMSRHTSTKVAKGHRSRPVGSRCRQAAEVEPNEAQMDMAKFSRRVASSMSTS
mmetsp:Transcript_11894/g.21756  ORF Transcript_11894/g.21756 Transcript_11894/m.21756 type:complete len:220 (+) Transcript_11894:612-1271(+)